MCVSAYIRKLYILDYKLVCLICLNIKFGLMPTEKCKKKLRGTAQKPVEDGESSSGNY